jgi:hypothetical protein
VQPRKRILLGHLGARGDCVYATAVARQIKVDYPDCQLTWAIGSMSRAIADGNPHVDAVWEVPMAGHDDMADAWESFHSSAIQRGNEGEFDEMFFTQIYPDNFGNFDGTVRSSIFRGYPRRITAPVTPVIRLSDREIENVRRFADAHGLVNHPRVILFEFTAGSAQTFVNAAFAHEASAKIVQCMPDSRIVLSSHVPHHSTDPRIIDGSALSFRENAELSKYCSLLIGCSSGISWLCTSDWAKRVPTIQLLSRRTSVYASMVHDHHYFGLSSDHVIEMTDCQVDRLVDCVRTIHQERFREAKQAYHETIPLRFDYYCEVLLFVIKRRQYGQVIKSILNTMRRYGPRPALIRAVCSVLLGNALNPLVDAVRRRLGSLRPRGKG